MKNVLIIGLGRFGRHIAMQLNQLNFYNPLELETTISVL